ncbi:MAG: putative lipid II flippase FtsW [Pseudomonadota bacterium]
MFNVFRDLDRTLLAVFFSLSMLGLLMMFSASIDFADHKYGSEFFHMKRQLFFWVLSLIGFVVVLNVKLEVWEKNSWIFLLGGFVLLILVFVPGIGVKVNGSYRWLNLGVFNLQSSELAKVGVLMYMASYLLRRQEEVRSQFMGMFKPMMVLGLTIVLLLFEPDFGSVVVLSAACLSMIYLSGVRVAFFFGLLFVVGAIGAVTVVSADYRLQRLECFLDPWAKDHVFGCGYQLTQSLIAIGSGGWFGTGLGNSVQKLFYLPESHTDFVFAILAEEMGLLGGLLVIGLFSTLIYKTMLIARTAETKKQFFGAYFAYGIAVLLAIQVFINIGVNTGLLPTPWLVLVHQLPGAAGGKGSTYVGAHNSCFVPLWAGTPSV